MRSAPYNMKDDQQLKEDRGYTKCSYKIVTSVITLLMKQHTLYAMLLVRRDPSCNSKTVIYVAYCIDCMKQGVGLSTSWKPRLSKYKSRVKKKN